jgi:hypothetical protein
MYQIFRYLRRRQKALPQDYCAISPVVSFVKSPLNLSVRLPHNRFVHLPKDSFVGLSMVRFAQRQGLNVILRQHDRSRVAFLLSQEKY